VPYPPDYGGAMDVFYRIKALSGIGLRIHLHCFTYGRKPSDKLNELCAEVTYYPRPLNPAALFSERPFIVKTRASRQLLQNLQNLEAPILFEGLHTCQWLDAPELAERFKLVRAHNIEHVYYRELGRSESNPFRKKYFQREARKLKRFESILNHADHLLAIGAHEFDHFRKTYKVPASLIYPFHPEIEPVIPRVNGNYLFYHGNLQVQENQKALNFLVREVLPYVEQNLIVAGKGARRAVSGLGIASERLKVYDHPDEELLISLARSASIHLLPTFQETGFKLKLLFSLMTGRAVLVNDQMIRGTGLNRFVFIANKREEWAEMIRELALSPPADEELNARFAFIQETFSNTAQARKIKDLLPAPISQ
jgi:glycosyltransferase involved in cell wall biosynthesis